MKSTSTFLPIVWKVTGYVVLLLLFAWAGKLAAERWVLPYSPPLKGVVPAGLVLDVPAAGEASHGGGDAAALRKFIFAKNNGFLEKDLLIPGGIVEVEPGVEVRVIETDADMVQVQFLEGGLEGRKLWMKSKPFLDALSAKQK